MHTKSTGKWKFSSHHLSGGQVQGASVVADQIRALRLGSADTLEQLIVLLLLRVKGIIA